MKSLLTALALAGLFSCEMREAGAPELVTVSFSLIERGGKFRSSCTAGENFIGDVQLAAYRVSDHTLTACTTGSTMALPAGCGYKFYALVNCPEMDFPISESALQECRISLSGRESFPDGLPMAGMKEVWVSGPDAKISLEVKRLVARMEFKFEDRDALGFKPAYVKIRQAAADIAPWKDSKATAASDGDYAREEELSRFGALLYLPENLRGKIPGITSPEGRVPSALGPESDLYTYLEVGMDFPEGGVIISNPDRKESRSDVIYRLYLGGNSTDDFDIRRNVDFSITLTATEATLLDGGMEWTVDSDLGYGGEETISAGPWDFGERPIVSDQTPECPAPVTIIDSTVGTNSYLVPRGMRFADLFIVSGGESGEKDITGSVLGGAGGYVWWTTIRVHEGMSLKCTVGAGGGSSTESDSQNEGGISSVSTRYGTYSADADFNYNTGRKRTCTVKAPDGIANPFDAEDKNLYGASGAGARTYYEHSQTPGRTGGGTAGTKKSKVSGGSFFGAGGGAALLKDSGAGYHGVTIIYLRPY